MVGFLEGHPLVAVRRPGPPLRPRGSWKWSRLSPAYRRRLEARGIHRLQYELGVPLRGARGHSTTPEHSVRRSPTSRLQKYRDVEVMFVAVWDGSRSSRRMGTPPLGVNRLAAEQAQPTEYIYRSLNYFLPLWWAWGEVVGEVMSWEPKDRNAVVYWIIESRSMMR